MPERSTRMVAAAALGISVCAFLATSSVATGGGQTLDVDRPICASDLVAAARLNVGAEQPVPDSRERSTCVPTVTSEPNGSAPTTTMSAMTTTPSDTVPTTTVEPGSDTTEPGWIEVGDEVVEYTDDRTSERYFFFDPEDNPDPTWGRTRIGWLVDCDSVKFAQIDPMVSPGVASHHLHEFFGNTNVTSRSTTRSFVETPRTDIRCTDVNDKSAYWSPAVYQGGRRITAEGFKAYYKSTTAETVPMPLGLRMVAGDAAATGNQHSLIGWFEEQRTDDLTPREDLTNTIGATEMITRQNEDVNLVLRINFPNCWDGVHLDSPDHRSHMAYFDEDALTCPDTHPVKIAQLTTFTRYDTPGGPDFSLASGEWFTFHQDFWNAWSPDQMADLNEQCLLAELNCRVNGSRSLEQLGQYSRLVPEPA